MSSAPDDLVQEQIAYYDARAAEYDRMLERAGRYRPDSLQSGFDDDETRDLDQVAAALAAVGPLGDVLEIACGTGWWTARLAARATTLTALDASEAMLDICRARVSGPLRLVQADVFDWRPERRYDTIFFSFWLSHVPPDRFADFWALLADAIAPRGRVFFVDEGLTDRMDGYEQRLDDGRGTTIRPLEDGRTFRMVKVYHRPDDLAEALAKLGWQARVVAVGNRFYHGQATLAGAG